MSKQHHTKRDERRAARARRRTINRVIAYALFVVGLVVIIWLVMIAVKNQASKTAAPTQGGATPVLISTKQYSSAPPMMIDVTKQYFATVKMAKGGEFIIQLYPDKAPITVNSFVFLARQGYYDGVTFHRVIEGFMAQTGDPTGLGNGGPGYTFDNEANDLAFDKAGVVAMANTGQPSSNGSQFFITFGPYGLSESDYTIFGQVTSGMDVVNGITRRDPRLNPTFTGDVIESITITEK
jgi:peptidylprolyl isomerase